DPGRFPKAPVAIKDPGTNLLSHRIPTDYFPPVGGGLISLYVDCANKEIFVSRPIDFGLDGLISALVLPGSCQPLKDLESRISAWRRGLPLGQLGNLPMIAFPDPDGGVPCCLRRAISRRHGSEPSSYLDVWSQLLDLFGRDCQFRAGILLKIIGQKPFHGIPSFNLCAVLIKVVNIVGIESGERFCITLIVSLLVFSTIVISCLICRGRLTLLLASG